MRFCSLKIKSYGFYLLRCWKEKSEQIEDIQHTRFHSEGDMKSFIVLALCLATALADGVIGIPFSVFVHCFFLIIFYDFSKFPSYLLKHNSNGFLFWC